MRLHLSQCSTRAQCSVRHGCRAALESRESTTVSPRQHSKGSFSASGTPHIALRSPAAKHSVKSNARSTFWADETRHADTRTSPAQRRVVQGSSRTMHLRHQVICQACSDKDIRTCTSIFRTCRTLQQRVHHDRTCRITITFTNTSFPNLHWRPTKLTSRSSMTLPSRQRSTCRTLPVHT